MKNKLKLTNKNLTCMCLFFDMRFYLTLLFFLNLIHATLIKKTCLCELNWRTEKNNKSIWL